MNLKSHAADVTSGIVGLKYRMVIKMKCFEQINDHNGSDETFSEILSGHLVCSNVKTG